MNKVMQFFDGKNFYANLRNYQDQNRVNLSIHYESLVKWVVDKMGSDSSHEGVHYYTAVNSNDDDGLKRFLNILEKKNGFYVHRFETIDKQRNCPHCETMISYQTEKGVDTMIVADMLSLSDPCDTVVLFSGDADLAPAVNILSKLGKKVFIAGWDEHGVSKKLRSAAFGYIDLTEGIDTFSDYSETEFTREEIDIDSTETEEAFLASLKSAQEHFENGFVGFNLFLKDWRDESLPKSIEDRRLVLERLAYDNKIEIYEVDNSKALRLLSPKAEIFI